jgi:hypothetical protein
MTGKNPNDRTAARNRAISAAYPDAIRLDTPDPSGAFMPALMKRDAGLPVRRHRASTPARRGAAPL